MNKKDIEAINPLSPAQQGMLYESIHAPESGIHIEQAAYTLTGALDRAAFERAWQWGVDRHAILRTGFVWKEQAEPLQVTMRNVQLPLEYQDWRLIPSSEQNARIESYLREDRTRGFNVTQMPLMRVALFRLDEQRHHFSWTFHHILMDGWSRQIVLNEIIACYTALSTNQSFSMQPSRPYSDYITWLKKQDVSEAEGFWRNMLHGFTRTTSLGIEQPGEVSDKSEEHAGQLQFQLSDTVTSNLRLVARSHRLKTNTLLQGVWALLLGRYSQSEDVVFGVTVSGRPAELVGVETIVGLCINTLPLRVQLPAQAAFWSWLSELQYLNLEMQHYEYCSSGQIHRWSDMPGMSPLYESLLVVENYPSTTDSDTIQMNVSVDNVLLVGAQTKYALVLIVSPGTKLTIDCIYTTHLFPLSSAQYIMDHLQQLLEYIASDPQVQLATLFNLIPDNQIPIVRSALPVVQQNRAYNQSAPRTPIKELIAAIWCDVLGMQQVGVESDFFTLGGHSLIATQMVSRLRTALNVEIPLRTIFEAPTIESLALRVEQALRKREGMTVPPLRATERPERIPLSFAQQRLWFLDQFEPASTAYLVPLALRIGGTLQADTLERSIETLIGRHESLRTTFEKYEGQPVQMIKPAGSWILPVIDLLGLEPEPREQQARQLVHQEALYPCDLARGPLIRVTLLRLKADEHILLLTLHHIITDRWSDEVMVRELITLYQAFAAGELSPLLPLPIQCADYALWQRQWLQGEVLQQQIAYWKKHLWRAQPLKLPTDVHHANAQGNSSARYFSHFSRESWQNFVKFSQREGVTSFMLLLAIFQVVLYRLSGQTDIVLGTDVANRTHIETEGLIGFFVNLIALRIDLQGAPSFRQVLQRVRDMVLEAYTHQVLPFEMVVENVQGERDMHRAPLVQALFVMQNIPPAKEKLSDVTFELVEEKDEVARFDLSVFLYEGEHGLNINTIYRTTLFHEQTIAMLLRRFAVLANSAIIEPDISIDKLDMYSKEEKTEQAHYEQEVQQEGRITWQKRKTKTIDVSELASSAMKLEKE